MLEFWQKEFPPAFEAHADILLETKRIQINLSNLLTSLDEQHLLHEEMVFALLELHYSSTDNILDLQKNLSDMITRSLLSLDILILLSKTPAPIRCMQFIMTTQTSNIDMKSIQGFLSKQSIIKGLSRAMTVFEQSHFEYSLENLERLSILAEVLANPLSQAIFDARTRTFSDYSTDSSEPMHSNCANNIINTLSLEKDHEKRIILFFTALSKLRPLPFSQKYKINLSLADEITTQLNTLDNAIPPSLQDPKAKNQTIFEQIKYAVAATIVSNDIYSTLSYEQLMDKILIELLKIRMKIQTETQATTNVTQTDRLFNSRQQKKNKHEEDEDPLAIINPYKTQKPN